MESVIGVVARFAMYVLFQFVLYWPGWLVLKIVTLGRYPASPMRRDAWYEFELVAVVGMLAIVGIGITVAALT
ncbi:hypothetical protein B551_0219935 [Cupriavidus sp. HPC(L)]|uniref:hypothetical protein n=1 Tax=Cupriavidus sp. HPC(L) TaxID=1217418 RepID=UPI000291C39A|nr:hypothetical protein [Cupriavidus sp. HPC(L)]ESH95102.1 hypothetical protein B551_0219935 [Cupriavidus sp. HPC(L)]